MASSLTLRSLARRHGSAGGKGNTMRTILRSDDFSCPSCVAKIETGLLKVPGVERAMVHFSTGRIEVLHDGDSVTADGLVAAVRELGYESRPSPF